MKKIIVWGISVISFFNAKLKLFCNSKNQPRKFNYLLSRLIVVFAVATLASCGDSKWSKSGQKIAERENKSVADSTAIPEQPNMSVRNFTIDSVQSEIPEENKDDLCGESQYPCHTFSVHLIILDSALNEYRIFISINKSKEPAEEGAQEFNFKMAFYNELINGDLTKLYASFIPKIQNGEGFSGYLYVKKYYPNSGKKIGNAHIIDEHSDEIFYGTVYMVPNKEHLAKLHAQKLVRDRQIK